MATAPKPLPLPESITRHAELQARLVGITPEEWLAQMVTFSLDTEEGAREFFRLRGEPAVPGAWKATLSSRLDCPPDTEGDIN